MPGKSSRQERTEMIKAIRAAEQDQRHCPSCSIPLNFDREGLPNSVTTILKSEKHKVICQRCKDTPPRRTGARPTAKRAAAAKPTQASKPHQIDNGSSVNFTG